MDTELMAIVHEVLDEMINVGNFDIVHELLDPSFVSHTPAGDLELEGFKEFVRAWKAGFPDLYFTMEELVQENDEVSWTMRVIGSHRGEFLAHPPTGKVLDVRAGNRIVARNGRPVEHWLVFDVEEFTGSPGEIPKEQLSESA